MTTGRCKVREIYYIGIFCLAFVLVTLIAARASDSNNDEILKAHDSDISTTQRGMPISDFSESREYNAILLKSGAFIPTERFTERAKNLLAPSAEQGGKNHLIVQFDHIPDNTEKEQLKDEGIFLLEYIPEKSWIAAISNSGLNVLSERPDVTFADYIAPSDKIDPAIKGRGFAERSKKADGKLTLQVKFFDDVAPSEAADIIIKYGEILEKSPSEKFLVNVDESNYAELLNENGIEWVEDAPAEMETLNDGARAATGVNYVQPDPYFLDGQDVTLAEWDAGWASHLDYNNRTTIGDQGASEHGHSTHVAGTMLGDGGNSVTFGSEYARQWQGMAPNATLITYEWPDTIAELDNETNLSITNYNAVLSQNSWGRKMFNCTDFGQYDSWSQEYDKLVDGDTTIVSGGKQITIVFAAGNNQSGGKTNCGTGYNTLAGPGQAAKNTIVVGAINANDLSMTSFSSWGPTADGRIKPDIVAPGCKTNDWITSTVTYWQYGGACGTSMAAPVVSGIAGLIVQDYRNLYAGDTPAPATVKAILVHTAKDLSYKGPDLTTGYGLVDAVSAIDLMRNAKQKNNANPIITTNGVSNGNNITYYLLVPSGIPELKVTLVWDDYRGSAYAAKELVNDLDLYVVAPNGTRHYPWTIDNSSYNQAAIRNKENSIDNIEQILAENPAAGNWTIAVKGTSIPQAPENYTLIISYPDAPGLYTAGIGILNLRNRTKLNGNNIQVVTKYIDSNYSLTGITLYLNGTNSSYKRGAQNNTNTIFDIGNVQDGVWTIWTNATFGNNDVRSSIYTITTDSTPPSDITNLAVSNINTYSLIWNWASPPEKDFHHFEVWLNGAYEKNIALPSFYKSSLMPNTTYEIQLRPVDDMGNTGNWTNNTARTSPLPYFDSFLVFAPTNNTITSNNNLTIAAIFTSNNFTDAYMSLYINGTNVTANKSAKNNTNTTLTAKELANGNWTFWVYIVSNKYSTLELNSPRYNIAIDTTQSVDSTPPSDILNLSDAASGTKWILWNWTNPSDSDFNHVEVYLNGTFKTNTSGTSYNATGLTKNTGYEIQTRTVDNTGNINTSWVNDSARTLPQESVPVITITSPANNTKQNTNSVRIVFTVTDNENTPAQVTVYFNGTNKTYNGTMQNNTDFDIQTSIIPDGSWIWWVNATLEDGRSVKSPSYVITIDTVGPSDITNLHVSSYGSDSTVSPAHRYWAYWKWTNPPDSDLDYVKIWVDGNIWAEKFSFYQSMKVVFPDPNTTHEIELRPVDKLGNIGNWTKSTVRTVAENETVGKNYSTEPPAITSFYSSPSNGNGTTTVTFYGAATDPDQAVLDYKIYYDINNINDNTIKWGGVGVTENWVGTNNYVAPRSGTRAYTARLEVSDGITTVSKDLLLTISSKDAPDITPPVNITKLNKSSKGETWIYWTWTNPIDADFNHAEIWLNETFKTNTSASNFNATELSDGTFYEIQIRPVDNTGNIGSWTNDSVETITAPDTTPPANITGLSEATKGETWIQWNWINPIDADFNHAEIWLNETFKQNISAPANYVVVSNLTPNTNYEIQIRPVDNSGNIGFWANNTARTLDTPSGNSGTGGGGGGSGGGITTTSNTPKKELAKTSAQEAKTTPAITKQAPVTITAPQVTAAQTDNSDRPTGFATLFGAVKSRNAVIIYSVTGTLALLYLAAKKGFLVRALKRIQPQKDEPTQEAQQENKTEEPKRE